MHFDRRVLVQVSLLVGTCLAPLSGVKAQGFATNVTAGGVAFGPSGDPESQIVSVAFTGTPAVVSFDESYFGTGLDAVAFRSEAGDRYVKAFTSASVSVPGAVFSSYASTGYTSYAIPGSSGVADVLALFDGTVRLDDPVGPSGTTRETNAVMTVKVRNLTTREIWQMGWGLQIKSGEFPFAGTYRYAFFQPEGGTEEYFFREDLRFDAATTHMLGGMQSMQMPVRFDSERVYEFAISAYCFSGPGDIAVAGDQAAAVCDFAQSAYWMGLSGFRDESGNAIGAFTLINGEGSDLALRSPSAPPDSPAVIPEPSAWAFLVTGFGLVGAVRRRRKSSAVPS